MLHPTIPIPSVGDTVSAINFDILEKVVKNDVKILTKFETMACAQPDWYIAFGHNLKTNYIESLVYFYDPGEGWSENDYPIGFGGCSEENFTPEQWDEIAAKFPTLIPKY